MRVRPNAAIAVGLWILYVGLVLATWLVNDTDYNTIVDSVDNIISSIVIPVAIGGAVLTVAGFALGWMPSAVTEPRRYGPTWGWAVLFFVLAAAVINVINADLGSLDSGIILWLAVSATLVGYSEELVNRGLVVVGLRGSMGEVGVWLVSSALFALLHGINAFVGQDIGPTIFQIVVTFFAGSAFYAIRMVSGTLIVAMLAHAAWDFGSFSASASDAEGGIGPIVGYVGILLALVLIPRITREKNDERTAQQAATKPEDSPPS